MLVTGKHKMYNRLAPVVVFAYNRHDHIERTIEYLLKNSLANETVLYIYSDAAKSEMDITNVKKVREFLHQITGFKKIVIIEREFNHGLAKNIIEGVTEVINKFAKAIVLEDDLLTSRNFLCYMNEALEYYQNDQDVFAISGYTGNLPYLTKLDYDTYLAYRPSSWGWGTWKHQWENIDWSVSDFEEFIKNKKEVKKFNRGGIDMARMLRHYIEGKNNSWAIRWSYEMYKRGHYCVYPKVSKIQNIGFGDDATHCKGIDIYKTVLDATENCKFKFSDSTNINETIVREFRYQFSYTNKAIKKVQGHIKRLIK